MDWDRYKEMRNKNWARKWAYRHAMVRGNFPSRCLMFLAYIADPSDEGKLGAYRYWRSM